MKNNIGNQSDYDERQIAARGQAFQLAYFTLLGMLFLYACSEGLFGRWCDAGAAAGLCACPSVTVFAVTCIWRDAYRRPNERPAGVIALMGFLAVVNLALGAVRICEGDVVQDGILTFSICNTAVGVMAAVILAAYLLRLLVLRKEQKEE